jgi:HD-like signal output (HDOD) protein
MTESQMSDTASEILDTELPAMPAALASLGAEMQKEDPDFQRVSMLVNADVGLAAAVVKIANSPFVGLGRKIGSVQQAVLYLGLAEVFSVVTGLLLRRSFRGGGQAMERLWDTAARRASWMSWLSRGTGSVKSDRAYTCGLFEDCGMAVLLLRAPGYAQTLAQIESADNPREVERQQHGLDHEVLSQALVRAWGLPDTIALAVRHHHDIATLEALELPAETQVLIALSACANEAVARNRGRTVTGWSQTREICGRILAVHPRQLDDKLDEMLAVRAAA